MEFLTTIVVEIGKYLLQPVLRPVERRVGYLVHCKENTEQLKNQVEKLKTVRESVQQLIDQAESRGEDILIDVTNWMGTVDSVINEANGLVDNSNVDSRCFIGLCPHCCSRYQLSKKAAEMMNGVNDLQEIGGCFNVVSHPLSPPPIEALCEGDFNVFESTRQVMEKVMNALRDQSINFIGLYGMGGVGKTTLVKEVGKRVQNEEKIFNKVVMAAVSQNPVLRNIQDDIASMLDLNFDPIENEKRRAWKLSERIKKENTILVILDDVWERLELGDVGIPHGDNHKGCKITLTTRREQVCRAMEVQERILLGTLCEQDAWSLFKSKAGSVVDDDNLRHVAREVAKECGGLPIALVTIARALRNEKELQAWKDTVTTLRKNEPNRIEGVDKKVISCIRLSYDYLNDREAQWLFLFCSLFPEDYNIEIEQMARYVFGLGCFENVDTIEDARCRVRMVVKKLKTSSLLLDGFVSSFLRISPSEEHFKMHDIVRDVAISMASDDSHHEVFLGRAGRGLTEYPKMESSERYTAISLISNSIWKLPNRSGLYPKLRVLLLQENRGLTEIADTFFEGMESLRVLDLSRTQVERFPPSIRCLTNLRTLHFVTNKQYLVDISMIGELKKLVILSLRSCLLSSAELPENIAHLTNLRMLDLSDSTQGANLVNVISGLYQLEELYLKLGGDLPDDFVFQGFVRFNIWINYMTSSYCTGTAAELYENTPHTLCLGDLSAERLKTLCSRLWKNTELLCLERCNDLKSMKELYEGGFGKLKHLCLQKCESLRSIFSLAEAQSLPQLEELFIDGCNNLEEIVAEDQVVLQDDQPQLKGLRTLTIVDCPSVRCLFSVVLAKNLPKLENLYIWNCDNMEYIVTKKNGEETMGNIIFPQLRILHLSVLWCLESFCGSGTSAVCPLLEEVIVAFCPNLQSFQLQVQNPSKLKKITVSSMHHFKGLKGMFSPQISQCLEELIIMDFNNLEEILFDENQAVVQDDQPQFLALKTLTVMNCNSSARCPISSLSARSLPKLEYIDLSHSHGLRNVFSASLTGNVPQLKKLDVRNCKSMQEIVAKEDGEECVDKITFFQLTHLNLAGLQCLVSICGCGVLSDWPLLEEVSVLDCPNLKHLPFRHQNAPKINKIEIVNRQQTLKELHESFSEEVKEFGKVIHMYGKDEYEQWLKHR